MNNDIDQDELAAAWGAEVNLLDDPSDDEIASQWSDIAGEEASESNKQSQFTGSKDRILSQNEIDELLGFKLDKKEDTEQIGIEKFVNSEEISYERLPMLEVIFDRLVRLLTTNLRNFTSDNVDVSISHITSKRFVDYLSSIPLPSIIGVYKVNEWNNLGLITVNSYLIYSIVDILLGGRDDNAPMRIEGRPYTTIELSLIKRLIDLILGDMSQAFNPIADINLSLERLETNPRFATIVRPANAVIEVGVRIEVGDRGGMVEILLPYATIEPVRDALLQKFMGEKLGRDKIWESHLSNELYKAQIELEACLAEKHIDLTKLISLKKGDIIMLDTHPHSTISVRCGNVELLQGSMGRVGQNIAIRISKKIKEKMKKEYMDLLD